MIHSQFNTQRRFFQLSPKQRAAGIVLLFWVVGILLSIALTNGQIVK